MHKILFPSLAAMLLVNTIAIGSNEDSVTAFIKCARIAGDAQRLSCYDRLATELIELGVSSPADATDGPSPAPSPAATAVPAGSSNGDEKMSAEKALPASQGVASGGGPNAVATSDEGFGLERVEEAQNKDVKSIQSRYVGEFTGWDGETTFPLENGQVWQQIESGRMSWKATDPMITIKRGFMGSYMLSVEGVNKRVRVKRIK